MSHDAERAAIVAAGARLAAAGLVVGGAGNISVRVDDRLVITPRGCRLAALHPDMLVVTDLDGRLVEGEGRVSSETQLHCAAYRATGAGAVVHTHPVFCTVVSTLADEIAGIHYAVALFGGSVRVAGYATFGSDELAANVAAALRERTGALMRNHGAVTVGDDLESALERTETLEWLAEVHYRAHLAGTPAVLTPEQIDAVRGQQVRLDGRTGP
jgi:L-fuculose-phosphate aldolase